MDSFVNTVSVLAEGKLRSAASICHRKHRLITAKYLSVEPCLQSIIRYIGRYLYNSTQLNDISCRVQNQTNSDPVSTKHVIQTAAEIRTKLHHYWSQ